MSRIARSMLRDGNMTPRDVVAIYATVTATHSVWGPRGEGDDAVVAAGPGGTIA